MSSVFDMKLQKQLFHPDMKMSDVLDTNPDIATVLSRLGIGLGFGEGSVREVCRSHGIDAATFLLICNVYTFAGYRPAAAELAEGHLLDVVKYLRRSHTYYNDTALPQLEESIREVISRCPKRLGFVVSKFFDDYRAELRKHFAFEEEMVFPYIQKLVLGESRGTFAIDDFKERHEVADEKLSDLKNLVMKTLPSGSDGQDCFALLSFLYFLHRDLTSHTRVEDEVMIPMARYVERPQSIAPAKQLSGSGHDGLADLISRETYERQTCGIDRFMPKPT